MGRYLFLMILFCIYSELYPSDSNSPIVVVTAKQSLSLKQWQKFFELDDRYTEELRRLKRGEPVYFDSILLGMDNLAAHTKGFIGGYTIKRISEERKEYIDRLLSSRHGISAKHK